MITDPEDAFELLNEAKSLHPRVSRPYLLFTGHLLNQYRNFETSLGTGNTTVTLAALMLREQGEIDLVPDTPQINDAGVHFRSKVNFMSSATSSLRGVELLQSVRVSRPGNSNGSPALITPTDNLEPWLHAVNKFYARSTAPILKTEKVALDTARDMYVQLHDHATIPHPEGTPDVLPELTEKPPVFQDFLGIQAVRGALQIEGRHRPLH